MSLFARLDAKTLHALQTIHDHDVRWDAASAGRFMIRIQLDPTGYDTYDAYTTASHNLPPLDISGISERYYQRIGYETSDHGTIELTEAGRAELARLLEDTP